MDMPIIVKIESQKCIGYEPRYRGHMASVIENIGVDKDGKRWKFTTYSEYDVNGFGSIRDKHDYQQII